METTKPINQQWQLDGIYAWFLHKDHRKGGASEVPAKHKLLINASFFYALLTLCLFFPMYPSIGHAQAISMGICLATLIGSPFINKFRRATSLPELVFAISTGALLLSGTVFSEGELAFLFFLLLFFTLVLLLFVLEKANRFPFCVSMTILGFSLWGLHVQGVLQPQFPALMQEKIGVGALLLLGMSGFGYLIFSYLSSQNGIRSQLQKSIASQESLNDRLYDRGKQLATALAHQKEINSKLQLSEHNLQALVGSLDDIVVQVDSKGKIINVWSSHEITEVFALEDVKGKDLAAFFEGNVFAEISDGLQSVLSTRKTACIEFKNRPSQKWYQAKMSHVDTGDDVQKQLCILFQDISQRKEAEALLRKSELALREAQHIANIGNWEYSLQEKRACWSAEMFRILGKPADYLPSLESIYQDYAGVDANILGKSIEEALVQGRDFDHKLRLGIGGGTGRYVRIIGKAERDGNVPVRLFGILQDITQEYEAEKALIQAKEEAEYAANAKTQFLSIMSHEIRTPMNAVIGSTHLLLQEQPRQDQMDHLHTLRFSSENLLALINDILDFSKIEAGKVEFEQVDFSLNDLCAGICHALSLKAEEKHIDLRVNIEKEVPETLIGDPTRLVQVLNNLIGNAIKFTERGFVELRISLELNMQEKVRLRFYVKDTGIGISPEKHSHIFELFSQASSDTTRKYGGTGLGLAITKRLLELQGSAIQVESELGKGSCFNFTLDFGMGLLEKKDNPLAIQSAHPIANSLEGYTVLVADDNPINIKIASKFLQKWGLVVEVAKNGKEAVEMAHEQVFDLVLMDLQMPEMDGYEATRHIKKLHPDTPVIALTASNLLEIQEEAIAAGLVDYAAKPFNPNELYKKVLKYLN